MRLIYMIKLILWAKYQRMVWDAQYRRSSLDQIIWRLEMSRASGDTKIALRVARKLYREIYGVKAPSDTERPIHTGK